MYVVFNRPTRGGPDGSTVTRRFLLKAFESAAVGSRVDLSFMNWFDAGFTESLTAIIAARNLTVRGVTGNGRPDPPPEPITAATATFFAGRGVAANVKPDGFVNHSKFVLFRTFDYQRFAGRAVGLRVQPAPSAPGPALYLGSGNIGEEQKHNAGVLIPLTNEMRNQVQEYFDDLLHSAVRATAPQGQPKPAPDPPDNRYRTVESSLAKLYFYPRRPFGDTLEGVIKNVQHYALNQPTSICNIMLVSPRWRSGRLGIAEALEHIYKRHRTRTHIHVVTRSPSDQFGDGTAELSPSVEAVLRRCATLHYQDSSSGINIHSKYLLIDAPYEQADGGYKHEQLVFVGSPNLTRSGVENHWEMIAKLKSVGAFAAFSLDFEHLKQYATKPPLPPIG